MRQIAGLLLSVVLALALCGCSAAFKGGHVSGGAEIEGVDVNVDVTIPPAGTEEAKND